MIFDDFLRGRRRDRLSSADLEILEAAASDLRTLPARRTIITRGQAVRHSTYLIDGFMCRYMDDREGERQLVAVHVPGDFVDLHAYPLETLDHDVATLTECRVALVPHDKLDAILATQANLAKLLWFSTLLDAAIHREWIFRLGRLSAAARVAHFFCEMEAKLRVIGRSDGKAFDLPLTQADLGEICGITAVHLNRMLRDLKERGLMAFRGGRVTIQDLPGLARFSEFDPGYLFVDQPGSVTSP
ncbi:Crp/Fnr family transcriptional regulator [Sphingomonas immobilis]|uniref:Crp/Fnr family transcriptional regulator n=1 Tax=Sphingomonas immobilis TaxID=3063997 RepID=A0ABT9A3A0_9SPHN|nr:Crp/Fnr family transcriptional regulator [Sphingomonas sp. CA1-15]MDO7843217.1 Crp/Fnr family transcriptional regulator [Sphingomonas sp. CA1-15]